MRYATFISYNHRDRKAASWLHRALETYRIPKRLRGRESAVGHLGARLPPIFQDREELAASSDLAVSVRAALEDASSLIVICSPSALALDLVRGGDARVDVARDLEALGSILFGRGDLKDAREAFERGFVIRLAAQGELHPVAMLDLIQLGSVAYMQGDSAAAERFFRRALPLNERVLGRDHPQVASVLNNIARLLIERRDYAGAVPPLRRAVAIEDRRGTDTDEQVFPLANLGIALKMVGQRGEAEQILERSRAIAARTDNRNLAPILVDLADLACDRGERATAQRLIAEARPIMAKTYPDDPWRMAWLELVDSQCVGDGPRTRRAARGVLLKWRPATHYGHRATVALARS